MLGAASIPSGAVLGFCEKFAAETSGLLDEGEFLPLRLGRPIFVGLLFLFGGDLVIADVVIVALFCEGE